MDEQSIPSALPEQPNPYSIHFRIYSELQGVDFKYLYSADRILKGVIAKEQIYTDFFNDIADITRYTHKHKHKPNAKPTKPISKSNSPLSIKLLNYAPTTEDLPHLATHSRRSCSQYDPKLVIANTSSLEVSPIKESKSLQN